MNIHLIFQNIVSQKYQIEGYKNELDAKGAPKLKTSPQLKIQCFLHCFHKAFDQKAILSPTDSLSAKTYKPPRFVYGHWPIFCQGLELCLELLISWRLGCRYHSFLKTRMAWVILVPPDLSSRRNVVENSQVFNCSLMCSPLFSCSLLNTITIVHSVTHEKGV